MSSVDPQPERPRKRRWPIWAVALLILLGGSYLLSQRSMASKSTAKGATPGGKNTRGRNARSAGAIPVSIAKARKGNMGVYISALGTVTPVYTAAITSRVAGQLIEVHYREGQMVHKGDLLALIDPRPYQAAYEQAQGQLQRDQALLHNDR